MILISYTKNKVDLSTISLKIENSIKNNLEKIDENTLYQTLK